MEAIIEGRHGERAEELAARVTGNYEIWRDTNDQYFAFASEDDVPEGMIFVGYSKELGNE